MSTVFGPVPSRRLGRSLGIDVIPSKTCTYDCVYCESGRTTHLTVQRRAFVTPQAVLQDIEHYFNVHPDGADVLTFSSAGEPTLYEALGEMVESLKRRYPHLPLVVLTNGSLLWIPEVRKGLLKADRVVPTLSAADAETFQLIHRPHPSLRLPEILEGLRAFRREYKGEFCLEVMLVSGVNDQPRHWKEIRRVMDDLQPDRVELNTVVRPPADPLVQSVPPDRMEEALRFFPEGKSCIIGRFNGHSTARKDACLAGRIVELVGRRPCTAGELSEALAVSTGDLDEVLAALERDKRLVRSVFNGREYICSPPGRTT